MNFVVSSDPKIDQHIIAALSPKEETPFEDLYRRAQEVLGFLKKSRFFRRFLAEKIDEQGNGRPFIRIARSSRETGSEWLILTDDGQLSFWLEGSGAIYQFGDIQHDSFLLAKARDRLAKMQGTIDAMRYLISRFGQPSFSADEIRAEMTRNGPLHLIEVVNLGDSLATRHDDTFRHRMGNLQFEITTERRDLVETRPLPEDGQFIILLDIAPRDVAEVTDFYAHLTPAQKRRLWTTKTGGETLYREFGFPTQILQYPGFIETCEIPDEALLEMLSLMFTDPK